MQAAQPLAVADVRSDVLPASKTHAKRSWYFVPGGDPTRPEVGTLTVKQGREVVSYLVGVSHTRPVEIYFARTDAEAHVYAVTVLFGQPAGCTCPGHRFTGHCKHKDAAAALIGDGVIVVR